MPTQDKMEKTRGVKLNFEYDPLAKYMCQVIFLSATLKIYFLKIIKYYLTLKFQQDIYLSIYLLCSTC